MKLEEYIWTRLTHKLHPNITDEELSDVVLDLIHELKEHELTQDKAIKMIARVIKDRSTHLHDLLLLLSKLTRK